MDSLRGGGALNMLVPAPLEYEVAPGRVSSPPAFCKAEVKFEACCPGGETEVCRGVERSMVGGGGGSGILGEGGVVGGEKKKMEKSFVSLLLLLLLLLLTCDG